MTTPQQKIGLTKRIHKSTIFKHGQKTMSKSYIIIIPCQSNHIGLGDALENIMIQYSDTSVFKRNVNCLTTYSRRDLRPQTIIANHANHNNIVPFVEDLALLENIEHDECREGYILRRNINLQRLHRKQTFWTICQKIRENLIVSLFSGCTITAIDTQPNNLFACLPQEIICLIVDNLDAIKLFENLI